MTMQQLITLVETQQISRMKVEERIQHVKIWVPKRKVQFMEAWISQHCRIGILYEVLPLNQPMKIRKVDWLTFTCPPVRQIDVKLNFEV